MRPVNSGDSWVDSHHPCLAHMLAKWCLIKQQLVTVVLVVLTVRVPQASEKGNMVGLAQVHTLSLFLSYPKLAGVIPKCEDSGWEIM